MPDVTEAAGIFDQCSEAAIPIGIEIASESECWIVTNKERLSGDQNAKS
jgi:hypothetical protein